MTAVKARMSSRKSSLASIKRLYSTIPPRARPKVGCSRARDRRAHLSRRGFYSGTDVESLQDTLIGQTDVEHEVGARLDFGHLRCALEELTTIQRRTLELFYFEGLELREISERLREPFGNVRHHFYRGLERLRKSPAVKRLRDNHNA